MEHPVLIGDKSLTKNEQKILGILQEHADWMTRKDIARVLHRGLLRNYSVNALNKMIARGIIEVRRTLGKTNTLRYEYRVTPPTPPAANGV